MDNVLIKLNILDQVFYANVSIFVSGYMLQTLYFLYLIEYLTKHGLRKTQFGHTNTPPPKTLGHRIKMQYFQNIFILLCALNVRF